MDIYSTASLPEFIILLGKEIYSVLVPGGRKALNSFINVLKSLSGSFGYDALIGLPSLDIRLEDIRTSRMPSGTCLIFR